MTALATLKAVACILGFYVVCLGGLVAIFIWLANQGRDPWTRNGR